MAEQPDAPVAEEAAQAEAARPVSLQSRIPLPRPLVVRGNLSQNCMERVSPDMGLLRSSHESQTAGKERAPNGNIYNMHWLRSSPDLQCTTFSDEAEKGDLDRVLDKMQKYCL